jgi:hypothetical protein
VGDRLIFNCGLLVPVPASRGEHRLIVSLNCCCGNGVSNSRKPSHHFLHRFRVIHYHVSWMVVLVTLLFQQIHLPLQDSRFAGDHGLLHCTKTLALSFTGA